MTGVTDANSSVSSTNVGVATSAQLTQQDDEEVGDGGDSNEEGGEGFLLVEAFNNARIDK